MPVVKVNLKRKGGAVEIDGHDISSCVRSIKIEAVAHEPVRVFLELVPEKVEVMADVDDEQIIASLLKRREAL